MKAKNTNRSSDRGSEQDTTNSVERKGKRAEKEQGTCIVLHYPSYYPALGLVWSLGNLETKPFAWDRDNDFAFAFPTDPYTV